MILKTTEKKKPTSHHLSCVNCMDFAKVWESKTFPNLTKSDVTAADLMDDYCGFQRQGLTNLLSWV